jgi:hypothetical protein
MTCDRKAWADTEGIRDSQIQTRRTDLVNKDFALEVIFKFRPEVEHPEVVIGIGENGRQGGWILNSALVKFELHGDKGVAHLKTHRKDLGKICDLRSRGPYRVRLTKQGDVLRVGVSTKTEGKFTADYVKAIPNFRETAQYLNRLNSPVFFAGDATFISMQLAIDGSFQDPGPAAPKPPTIEGTSHLIRLNPGKSLPPYMEPNRNILIDDKGLPLRREHDELVIRTKARDFITKDFTFDIVYQIDEDEFRPMVAGMGEDKWEGNWILGSVCSRVHSARHEGRATITYHHEHHEPTYARLGPGQKGINMLRIQKVGNTLTFAICANFEGEFVPDFQGTVPSLKDQADYLTKVNSNLFVGHGGRVLQIGLIVEG